MTLRESWETLGIDNYKASTTLNIRGKAWEKEFDRITTIKQWVKKMEEKVKSHQMHILKKVRKPEPHKSGIRNVGLKDDQRSLQTHQYN